MAAIEAKSFDSPDEVRFVLFDQGTYDAYADALGRLMLDDGLLERLRGGCRAAADKYTVEAMAENFADGVLRALNDFSVRP